MSAVWITLAVLGGLLLAGAVGRFLWSLRPQPGSGGLPPTPLERLAWFGLGITTVVGVGLAVLVALQGATGFQEDATSRGIFTTLMLVGVGGWSMAWYVTNRRSGGVVVDERDRAVLVRSLKVESVIVLLSLVAWTVALTEVFWDQGAVPIGYLQVLFWSTFIGGAFGRSLGIILGYRQDIAVDA